MQITKPTFYKEFSCIAGACPDTCCAGWQIMIDEKSLQKYRRFKGPFRNRLHNDIDWKEHSFCQYPCIDGSALYVPSSSILLKLSFTAATSSLCQLCQLIKEFTDVKRNRLTNVNQVIVCLLHSLFCHQLLFVKLLTRTQS